jgi:hypothetical protein
MMCTDSVFLRGNLAAHLSHLGLGSILLAVRRRPSGLIILDSCREIARLLFMMTVDCTPSCARRANVDDEETHQRKPLVLTWKSKVLRTTKRAWPQETCLKLATRKGSQTSVTQPESQICAAHRIVDPWGAIERGRGTARGESLNPHPALPCSSLGDRARVLISLRTWD